MLDNLKKAKVSEAMKVIKIIFILAVVIGNMLVLSGCWNYREIEKMSIVAGAAIDKTDNNQYCITVEIADAESGQEHKITQKLVSMQGDTIFDAIRNNISVNGQKLYWSHTKVIILSKNVAKDDIVKILDWYNRDAESRADTHFLVSKEKTAKEIFDSKGVMDEIVSFEIDDILDNQKSLFKSHNMSISEFVVDLAGEGISPVAQSVGIKRINGHDSPHIMGVSVFDKNKFVGFLSGYETQTLLFIKDMIQGGVLVQEENSKSETIKTTLEIIKSETKVQPIFTGNKVKIKLNIEVTVAIDEIQGSKNYMKGGNSMKLQKSIERDLNKRIENLIKKAQSEYNADIFGFGKKIKENLPNEWKKIGQNWKKNFKKLEVIVNTKVNIKNSASLYKTLPVGN